jgi:arginine/lysine/ornithine decarboxylase
MMNTPICDFVNNYIKSDNLRLHMPGHKGRDLLGFESSDITEIDGADSLFEADGIIAKSEANASLLFGADSFYSTEGSSLCIRAMIFLARLYGCTRIFAARNAHKSFLSACALNGIDPCWLYPEESKSYLSSGDIINALTRELSATNEKCACYITSPDYLGNIADIRKIAKVCKEHGCILLVDNAHGAYLKFLPESCHPIDLGADICCDSAHKTLPVITGGAYLHISKSAPATFKENAKYALSLFGSTSPSYLILQSLDNANALLAHGYKERITQFLPQVEALKEYLTSAGYTLCGNEQFKIVISAKKYGYYGQELASILREKGITCEFYDNDFLVLMLTPETEKEGLDRIKAAFSEIKQKSEITQLPPLPDRLDKVMSLRDAVFAECEFIKACESEGRILSRASISCPPAVPIAVCGERISKKTIECFEYYGISGVYVVK